LLRRISMVTQDHYHDHHSNKEIFLAREPCVMLLTDTADISSTFLQYFIFWAGFHYAFKVSIWAVLEGKYIRSLNDCLDLKWALKKINKSTVHKDKYFHSPFGKSHSLQASIRIMKWSASTLLLFYDLLFIFIIVIYVLLINLLFLADPYESTCSSSNFWSKNQ